MMFIGKFKTNISNIDSLIFTIPNMFKFFNLAVQENLWKLWNKLHFTAIVTDHLLWFVLFVSLSLVLSLVLSLGWCRTPPFLSRDLYPVSIVPQWDQDPGKYKYNRKYNPHPINTGNKW